MESLVLYRRSGIGVCWRSRETVEFFLESEL
jgi:hypothetical protein